MCRRLRCLVPHHVQQFFDYLDEDLRMEGRRSATLADVERVYRGRCWASADRWTSTTTRTG